MPLPHIIRAEQWVPKPIEQVFEFFSDANNLERITPPFLNFKILSIEPPQVQVGTLIRYRLRWGIVPLFWKTKITAWEPPHRFKDFQLSGPYKLWDHEHRFVSERGGTRLIDEVHYALHFGPLGRLANHLIVRKDVEKIFAYRKKAIRELFGGEE